MVINLAGRNVNCRYTPRNRTAIMQSRIESTHVIGQAIAQAIRPPRVWLQAGTATIYAHRYDAPNDEMTRILGGTEPDAPDTWKFSTDVATAWERAMDEAGPLRQARKVVLRSAMTMSPDAGGVFDVLLRLVRFGLGGQSGNGRQYVSWIHETDFIRAVRWLAENETFSAAVVPRCATRCLKLAWSSLPRPAMLEAWCWATPASAGEYESAGLPCWARNELRSSAWARPGVSARATAGKSDRNSVMCTGEQR